MIWRQFDYWLTVYRRTWRGSVVSSFVAPVLYLTAMGVVLGDFVDAGGSRLGGAASYLQVVAPGLLAAHGMQVAMAEMTWPVMGKLKWHKTYFAMVCTPLRPRDLFGAHLGFVLFRVGLTAAVFMLVLSGFGVYHSFSGVVPAFAATVLVGAAFATPCYAIAVKARSEAIFPVIFRVVVMPLFLFSGAFFPVGNLPGPLTWIALLTPLWHGVELTRMFLLDAVAWPAAAGHVAYLAVLAAFGAWLSVRRLTRRLIA